MEKLMEEEEYNWREVKLPSLIPIVPEPELERETGERRRGRDIIIAVDHGPNSKHAFHWAITHLCRLADTIHLVHAVSSKPNFIFVLAFRKIAVSYTRDADNLDLDGFGHLGLIFGTNLFVFK